MFSREFINPVSYIACDFQNFRSHPHIPWPHKNNAIFIALLWAMTGLDAAS